MLVHDELFTEAPPDAVQEEARLLEEDMLAAFRLICPDVGPYARVDISAGLTKWGEATDKDGNAYPTLETRCAIPEPGAALVS